MAKEKKKKGRKRGKKDAAASTASPAKLSREAYEEELYKLHAELVKLQYWVRQTGARVIVVFEGRDAAGKGGVIKRITERVSPRVFRVVALPAPSEQERGQMYGQRYISQFPTAGEVVLFDRSWYNRAGVERVMGFCSEQASKKFLADIPLFEKMIIDSGTILIKYWFNVTQEEQERRFRARIEDPRKIWKLSPMDVESYQRWNQYSRARDEMLAATDTEFSPWHIVRSNNKKRARLNCISHMLSQIPYEELPREPVDLGKRSDKDAYDDQAALDGRNFIPELF